MPSPARPQGRFQPARSPRAGLEGLRQSVVFLLQGATRPAARPRWRRPLAVARPRPGAWPPRRCALLSRSRTSASARCQSPWGPPQAARQGPQSQRPRPSPKTKPYRKNALRIRPPPLPSSCRTLLRHAGINSTTPAPGNVQALANSPSAPEAARSTRPPGVVHPPRPSGRRQYMASRPGAARAPTSCPSSSSDSSETSTCSPYMASMRRATRVPAQSISGQGKLIVVQRGMQYSQASARSWARKGISAATLWPSRPGQGVEQGLQILAHGNKGFLRWARPRWPRPHGDVALCLQSVAEPHFAHQELALLGGKVVALLGPSGRPRPGPGPGSWPPNAGLVGLLGRHGPRGRSCRAGQNTTARAAARFAVFMVLSPSWAIKKPSGGGNKNEDDSYNHFHLKATTRRRKIHHSPSAPRKSRPSASAVESTITAPGTGPFPSRGEPSRAGNSRATGRSHQ